MKKGELRHLREEVGMLRDALAAVEVSAREWPRFSALHPLEANVWHMALGLEGMEELRVREEAASSRVRWLEIELRRARNKPEKKRTYRCPLRQKG